MSQKQIRRMSVDEIENKIGVMVYPDQLQYIIKDDFYMEEVTEHKCTNLDEKQVYKYIVENPDKIDKERMIFFTAWNLRNLDDRSVGNSMFQDSLKIALDLLQGSNVEIPIICERNGKNVIKEFWTANDLLPNKKNGEKNKILKEENLKIVKDLENSGLMDMIFHMSYLDDFQDYLSYYPGSGKYFKFIIIDNANEKYDNIMEQKENHDLSEKEKSNIYMEQYKQEFIEIIENHCDKFDMEKLLLMSSYRAKDILENWLGITEEENQELIGIMNYTSETLTNERMKVYGNIKRRTIGKKKYVEYSYKELQDDLLRIVNGKYFSKEELKSLKNSLLEDNNKMSKVSSAKLFELLNFSTAEKRKLVELDPSNLEELLRLRAFNREELQEIINSGIGEYKLDSIFLGYLYEAALIESRDVLKMYMKNHVELAKTLDFELVYGGLESEVTPEELVKYYQEAKGDSEKIRDFDRYSLLFRELKIKQKNPEMQQEIAGQIAMQICELDSEYDDFKNLYQSNLLPIETLVEWNGKEIIYDLIQNDSLRPRDAKDLLLTGELDLEKVAMSLRKSELSETEKLNFIFSSFDGVGKTEDEEMMQNEARMKLLQVISVSKEIGSLNKNTHKQRQTIDPKDKKEISKFVINPAQRWQFFSLLDENLSTEAFLDGTVIFTLPNIQNGTIIIEKMLKHTKYGNKLDYGVATYMMSQEEFCNCRSQIVQGKKIERKVLIDMAEKEKATKLIHAPNWGNRVKEELDISMENGYTQEKIERIDTLIAGLEKARERID